MNHEMIVTLSKGQQITIPSEIRIELGLDIGSKMEMGMEGKNIILKPIGNDLEKLFQEAKKIKPRHNLTPEQMDALNEKRFR